MEEHVVLCFFRSVQDHATKSQNRIREIQRIEDGSSHGPISERIWNQTENLKILQLYTCIHVMDNKEDKLNHATLF